MQPALQLLLWRLVRLITSSAVSSLQGSPALPAITQQLGNVLASLPASWMAAVNGASNGGNATVPGGQQQQQQQHTFLTDVELQQLLQDSYSLLLLLAEQQSQLPDHATVAVNTLQQQWLQAQQQLQRVAQQRQSSGAKGLTFTWVESPLVTAIREGYWVSAR